MTGRGAAGWLLCLLLPAVAPAQSTTIELTGGTQSLSGAYGDGGSLGVRIRHARGRDVWHAAVSRESGFGDQGYWGSIANTHVFDPRWYSYVSAAASTEVFFLPRYRIDGQLARKFGPELRWVVSAAMTASAAHDEHRDIGAGVGLVRYLTDYLILDGSVFWNRSSPGAVIARRQRAAVTFVRPQHYQLSLRAGYGGEAYQLTGAASVLIDFNSVEAGITWELWTSGSTGFSLGAEYYDNPAYHRTGLFASVFKRFGS